MGVCQLREWSFSSFAYKIHRSQSIFSIQRVGAWGFMAGTEFTEASRRHPTKTTLNAGLYDQRAALEWTQKNIKKLGGNKSMVTIWGQSAGAISVGIQLIANGGDPSSLFQAAFMTSGSPGYGGVLSPSHSRLDTTWDSL
jgi:acetylcholinesterase